MTWTPELSTLARALFVALLAVGARTALVRRGAPVLGRLMWATKGGNEGQVEAQKRVETLSRTVVQVASVLILVVAFLTILAEFGINLAPILAGFGVAGVAVGFGAQALVRDVLNGFFIILENQYGLGDVVVVADHAGLVEEVNLRRTVLRDLDGAVHSIPNGEIRIVSNLTRDWSRVNLNIPVSYETDVDHAVSVLNRIGHDMAADPAVGPLIVEAPQVLRVDALEDSGYALKVLGVTRPIHQWDVMGELRKRVLQTFPREGIEIPYPHTVLLAKEAGQLSSRRRKAKPATAGEPSDSRV